MFPIQTLASLERVASITQGLLWIVIWAKNWRGTVLNSMGVASIGYISYARVSRCCTSPRILPSQRPPAIQHVQSSWHWIFNIVSECYFRFWCISNLLYSVPRGVHYHRLTLESVWYVFRNWPFIQVYWRTFRCACYSIDDIVLCSHYSVRFICKLLTSSFHAMTYASSWLQTKRENTSNYCFPLFNNPCSFRLNDHLCGRLHAILSHQFDVWSQGVLAIRRRYYLGGRRTFHNMEFDGLPG